MVDVNKSEIEIIRPFRNNPPVDVVGAIKALGIHYVERLMDQSQSGYFRDTGSGYEIGVNALDGEQRKRFTAAHELGHFLMHRDLLGPGEHLDRLYGKYASSNPSGPFSPSHEVQANRFAADFLMPANLVSLAYRDDKDVGSLALRFGVSKAATEIRLSNLGLK